METPGEEYKYTLFFLYTLIIWHKNSNYKGGRMKKLLKLRLESNFMVALSASIITPSFIKMQGGELFDTKTLSLVLLLGSSMQILQVLFNKVETRVSILLPVYYGFAYTALIVMLYTDQRIFVVSGIVVWAVESMLVLNRNVVIAEILKKHYNLSKFKNKSVSVSYIGASIGLLISSLFGNIISSNGLILIGLILHLSVVLPLYLLINKRIMNININPTQ